MKRIAILGGTSHIAKGLIFNYVKQSDCQLFLYVRSLERMNEFIATLNCQSMVSVHALAEFDKGHDFDVVINCVGINNSQDISKKIVTVFKLTEEYDDLALNYLAMNPSALYVNFSSGAVFGTDFSRPVEISTLSKWNINQVDESEYYGIAKLNSEIKHRALKKRNIVDLRVYGYFSRFIDLSLRFLLTEMISCLLEQKEFVTNREDVFRDYVHPEDLFALVEKCIKKGKLNAAFDVYSLKPISKFEILDFFASEYDLKYRVEEDLKVSALTGTKNNYYSTNKKAQEFGYFPRYTSFDCIKQEVELILRSKKEQLNAAN